MQKVEQRISQAGFARLKYQMMIAELNGNGPDACAAIGLTSVGLSPRPGVEVVFVVDNTLSGPVYPFMDHPVYTDASR